MLHKLLVTAAWIALALIVFVTLSPLETRPVITKNPNMEPFAAFALVGLLFGLAYPIRLAVDVSFVVIVAGVLETLQLMHPGPPWPHCGRVRKSGGRSL